MKNNAIRTIRSEEITIDVRICAALAANRGSGEVYLAAIAPDMELTIITLDEAPGILPCFEEDDACLNLPDTSLLAPPNVYDAKYVKWSIADLPILPERWQYLVSASTQKQFGILQKLMHRPDVDSIVNSCDAGQCGWVT